MRQYYGGSIFAEREIQDFFNQWLERLKNQIPYVGYLIFLEKVALPIGITIIGEPDSPLEKENGVIEFSLVLSPKYWGKGIGKAVSNLMLYFLIPQLITKNYLFDGNPIKKIVTAAQVDNKPAIQIAKYLGFREEFKNERIMCFSMLVNEKQGSRWHLTPGFDEFINKFY